MGVVHHIDIKYFNVNLNKLVETFFIELDKNNYWIDISEPENNFEPNNIKLKEVKELINNVGFAAIHISNKKSFNVSIYIHKDTLSLWFETFVFYQGANDIIKSFFDITYDIMKDHTTEIKYSVDQEPVIQQSQFSKEFLRKLFSEIEIYKRD